MKKKKKSPIFMHDSFLGCHASDSRILNNKINVATKIHLNFTSIIPKFPLATHVCMAVGPTNVEVFEKGVKFFFNDFAVLVSLIYP